MDGLAVLAAISDVASPTAVVIVFGAVPLVIAAFKVWLGVRAWDDDARVLPLARPRYREPAGRGTGHLPQQPRIVSMTPDIEFDPDDNFANGLEPLPAELEDDATGEALAWQLLLLVNPGDEDAALAQFADYQDALREDPDADPVALLGDVTDWKSGFRVDDVDAATCVDAIDELASRWNLRVDWGVDDPADAIDPGGADVSALVRIAFDRLREDGYTLWTYDTGAEVTAGWVTLSRDDEALRMVAAALGIDVRMGAG